MAGNGQWINQGCQLITGMTFQGLDIKLAWEHLKLQHLQLLAAAAFHTPALRDGFEHDLRSWLALPPFYGIGYAAGIECALRMMSVLVILEWHPQWPEDLHRQLWQRLHDLHQWILRYPSLHSSGNNHRVAEVTACFIIECLVPQWRPITLAARSAQLVRRLERQFHCRWCRHRTGSLLSGIW